GGETNVANLVTLCSYHNGVNEDDPNAPPRRGRLTRKGGTIVWQPPHTSR
ncbi:MAG: HNH endonuclease, partial [Corynebacterium flavescens]|nr:HNH endonuclease [Corynebacterium flavescens]